LESYLNCMTPIFWLTAFVGGQNRQSELLQHFTRFLPSWIFNIDYYNIASIIYR
jgi:hypothetical protein